MSAEEVIKKIENLDKDDKERVLKHVFDKYLKKNVAVLGSNYNWWNNEEDDIYNEQ